MTSNRLTLVLSLILISSGVGATQPFAPVVTMRVTLPDGQSRDLAVPESGVATLTLKDGTEYSFRPTIYDSSPWNRVVVTVFKTGTADAPTGILGDVELKRGGSAVATKTLPPFKVAVTDVSPSQTQTGASATTS